MVEVSNSELTDKKQRRKRVNLYRLPPKSFEGKEDVISFTNLAKTYKLSGRDEDVLALR
jgi:hypothetical protein